MSWDDDDFDVDAVMNAPTKKEEPKAAPPEKAVEQFEPLIAESPADQAAAAARAALEAKRQLYAELEAFAPPGSPVDPGAYGRAPAPKQAMTGFAAHTVGPVHSRAFVTADGVHTWVPPVAKDYDPESLWLAKQASWTLLGDGRLEYCELEVMRVQPGAANDLLIGLVQKPQDFSDWRDYACAADLNCECPALSLYYVGGAMVTTEDAPAGAPLRAGDKLSIWFKQKELRIAHNGRALVRLAADVPEAALLVQLKGRATQLKAKVAHPSAAASSGGFAALPLHGASSRAEKWTAEECAVLEPIW